MIDAAKTVYLLADSKKFGKREFAAFGAMDRIDYLVTDEGLGADFAQWLADNGTQIIYAHDESDRSAG
jgi:DeoR/GlpR family transcriptional regulator of sugar metabolism